MAANLAVVRRVTARSFADRQVILDYPAEVPRDDPGCPSAPHAAAPVNSPAACTVAATSWTLTTATPQAIAHTAVAREPSNRSSVPSGGTSPTRPSGDPPTPRWPINALRLVPTSTGTPVATELRERGKELEVVANRLAEPDPGVDVDLRDASCTGLRDASLEISPDLTDNVVVMWIELHVRGHSSAMHRYEPGAMFGGNRRQARRDIVQQGCPRRQCGAWRPMPWSCRSRPEPHPRAPRPPAGHGAAPRREGQLKHRDASTHPRCRRCPHLRPPFGARGARQPRGRRRGRRLKTSRM